MKYWATMLRYERCCLFCSVCFWLCLNKLKNTVGEVCEIGLFMFCFTNRVTEHSLESLFISQVIIAHTGTQRSYLQLLLCLKNGCHAQKTSLWAQRIKAHLPLIFNVPLPDMLMKGNKKVIYFPFWKIDLWQKHQAIKMI